MRCLDCTEPAPWFLWSKWRTSTRGILRCPECGTRARLENTMTIAAGLLVIGPYALLLAMVGLPEWGPPLVVAVGSATPLFFVLWTVHHAFSYLVPLDVDDRSPRRRRFR